MRAKLSIPSHSGELEVSPTDLNAFQKFFSNITPDFIKDGLGIYSDNMKFARWKNVLRIMHEAQKIRENYNLEVVPLPLKTSVEYLEAASLEEDATMQTMWANLLANMSIGNGSMHATYISILKELSPLEAKILNKFFLIARASKPKVLSRMRLRRSGLIKEFRVEGDIVEIALENLIRLRLLKQPEKRQTSIPYFPVGPFSGTMQSSLSYSGGLSGSSSNQINAETQKILNYLKEEERNASEVLDMLGLTSLGFSLLNACNEPEIK